MRQSPLIIFLHVPKTAGTTLRLVLEREYKPSAVYHVTTQETEEAIKHLSSLPFKERDAIQVLSGHICYGVHHYLTQPFEYITVLREPVARVLSHYYYVRRLPQHFLHKEITSRRVSLAEFVARELSLEVDNGQVRQLSGMPDVFKTIAYGQCTREMLEMAKKNLRAHFPVVGLTEDFDRSLILMQKVFGWSLPFYLNENVTRNRPAVQNINRETIDLIRRQNELDFELYSYAQELFREQLARQAPSFEEEVKRFQELNRSYGKVYALIVSYLNKARKARGRIADRLAQSLARMTISA